MHGSKQLLVFTFDCTFVFSILQYRKPYLCCCRSQPEVQQSSSYSVDISYHPSNGHIDSLSPNSTVHLPDNPTGTLVSRTQKHQTTQQVSDSLIC